MPRLFLFIGACALLVAATLPATNLLYQEVVSTNGQSVDQQRVFTKQYLVALDKDKPKRQRGEWQANADSTTYVFDSELLLYNRKTVKSPLGALTYRTTIELKEGKYRYTADSAFFQPYRRNRYSRYVPSREPATPWEQAQLALPEPVQQRALMTVRDRFAAFRQAMAQQQTNLPASKSQDDW